MENQFFSEVNLLKKKKKDDRSSLLEQLQKTKKSNTLRTVEPSRMDEERLPDNHRNQSGTISKNAKLSSNTHRNIEAASRITHLVKRFLIRRRICRQALKGLQKMVEGIRSILQRFPDVRREVFLESGTLKNMLVEARLAWVTGLKYYRETIGVKKPNLSQLVNDYFQELVNLISFINQSYDQDTTRVSLLQGLIVRFPTDLPLHMAFHSFTKIILSLETQITFISHPALKLQILKYYTTLLNPRFIWNSPNIWPRNTDAAIFQRMFFEVYFGEYQLTKVSHNALLQLEKQSSLASTDLIKNLQLACFCEYVMAKKIVETQAVAATGSEMLSAFKTQHQLEVLLLSSFEACLGGPGLIEIFHPKLLQDQALGGMITSLLSRLGGVPFVDEKTVNRDSKKYLLFSLLHLFVKLLQDQNVEEA